MAHCLGVCCDYIWDRRSERKLNKINEEKNATKVWNKHLQWSFTPNPLLFFPPRTHFIQHIIHRTITALNAISCSARCRTGKLNILLCASFWFNLNLCCLCCLRAQIRQDNSSSFCHFLNRNVIYAKVSEAGESDAGSVQNCAKRMVIKGKNDSRNYREKCTLISGQRRTDLKRCSKNYFRQICRINLCV